jgi:hypothetical protein
MRYATFFDASRQMSLGESDGSKYHVLMPLPGKKWRHITFGTHNSWLPGDPRGFRDHDHRLHSSGHHRAPPPEGEHDGLHAYAREHSSNPVIIPKTQRLIVLNAIQNKLDQLNFRYVIIASCAMHVHLLVELEDYLPHIKKVTGQLKACYSRHVAWTHLGTRWELRTSRGN